MKIEIAELFLIRLTRLQSYSLVLNFSSAFFTCIVDPFFTGAWQSQTVFGKQLEARTDYIPILPWPPSKYFVEPFTKH